MNPLLLAVSVGVLFEFLLGRWVALVLASTGGLALRNRGLSHVRAAVPSAMAVMVGPNLWSRWPQRERLMVSKAVLPEYVLLSMTKVERLEVALALWGPYVEQDSALSIAPTMGWKMTAGAIATALGSGMFSSVAAEFMRIAGFESLWDRLMGNYAVGQVAFGVLGDRAAVEGDVLRALKGLTKDAALAGASTIPRSFSDLLSLALPFTTDSIVGAPADIEQELPPDVGDDDLGGWSP